MLIPKDTSRKQTKICGKLLYTKYYDQTSSDKMNNNSLEKQSDSKRQENDYHSLSHLWDSGIIQSRVTAGSRK
uniref:Ovule protein n=1 Tax=Heterorhabditis bacteriophora TaxID=37862 RepID=A0A1I7WCS9_HETBA